MGLHRLFKQFLIIVAICSYACTNGQTRFYMFPTISAAQNPTPNAGWNVTTLNSWGMMIPAKAAYSNSQIPVSDQIGGVAPRKAIIKTYISQPLIAQTINSGSTISAQMRMSISSVSGTTGQGFVYVRVINDDGTVATEVANVATTNLSSAMTNRTYSITLGSNITITDNQRLCFEFGWNESVGTNTTRTASLSSSLVATTTDLPVDNTTTTALVSWIEFSQTISLSNLNGKVLL